jgi:asparagine N-glycosylation enzyme membrane subunit Stt3
MLLIEALLIGIISVIVPGFLLALALLHKTKMNKVFIFMIGIAFGLIFPPVMIWLESYLIPISPIFAFSAGLYDANVVILTIIGFVLSVREGAIDLPALQSMLGVARTAKHKHSTTVKEEIAQDYKSRLQNLRERAATNSAILKVIKAHEKDEEYLFHRHSEELASLKDIGPEERKNIEERHAKEERRLYEEHETEEMELIGEKQKGSEKSAAMNYVYLGLVIFMLITFLTRIANIAVSPTYFEFDPYYDMISTEYILVHGYQLLYDNAAWPGHLNVSIHRIQPLIPYLEAYWYSISNTASASAHYVNTSLLSIVSSYYPPITAALLVFSVFIFLYYEYGKVPALLGAGLATFMPALITTFIAGEQLLEPWGIFAMFFFYATYLLAVNNPKEYRYTILAGLAFASNFFGAHYYTVTTGVLGIYILLQGVINVLKNKDNMDFYKMNILLIIIIAITYTIYGAYSATLTARTPSILGVPTVVSLPLVALIFVAILEYLPKLLESKKYLKKVDMYTYLGLLAVLAIIAIIAIEFTPIGTPFQKYIALSVHFTTPSIPLFMTVQEYAPTGFNYDFGAAGFGIIGASIGGISILIWGVLLVFTALMLYAIIKRDSRSSVLTLAMVWPLAIAGMSEVKYLPHFGVGYIIAIGAIIGEIMIIYPQYRKLHYTNPVLIAALIIFLVEFAQVAPAFGAFFSPNCTTINNQGNSIAADMYCNQVPGYWINATNWMQKNVGPYAPRILAWWDYGDWINWFGNSNAVLRGDNAVAKLDYATAAQYVLGPKDGYNTTELRNFMNGNQSGYILMDNELVPKWGALDFLACIDTNQTTMQYAESQGAAQGQPYLLGSSPCELAHDPAFIYIDISQSVSNYCQYGNSTSVALKGFLVVGNNPLNKTYCVPVSFLESSNTTSYVYTSNGIKTNMMLAAQPILYGGAANISGQTFISFMVLMVPNGPNKTITDAPSLFYDSNYYKGFFLGHLNGFTLVYPSNFTGGVNYINSTNEIMIYKLNNFTGSLPNVTPKASWIHNNLTMPG